MKLRSLCPCIVQGTSVQPTYGHCDVGLAFHIEEGYFNGVSLAELNFLAANYTPGPMGDGNWTSGFYVDEVATPEQREGMEQILSGRMGGLTLTLPRCDGRGNIVCGEVTDS